jgi:broad specificity phosphatase PhoE
MIILIRHAQSEGNKNRDIHQFIPDHRVKLTPHGVTQVRLSHSASLIRLETDRLILGGGSRPTAPLPAEAG